MAITLSDKSSVLLLHDELAVTKSYLTKITQLTIK
jgi:hypothetical protein